MLETRVRMLGEARALRGAFPDADALRALPVSAMPAKPTNENAEATVWRTSLGYLHAEMLLVQTGKATNLTVLDDEIACVERLLLRT